MKRSVPYTPGKHPCSECEVGEGRGRMVASTSRYPWAEGGDRGQTSAHHLRNLRALFSSCYLPWVEHLFFFFFLRAAPMAHGSSRLGVVSELHLPAYATAITTVGSEPHPQPTPQPTANRRIPNPTEQGQGMNPSPHVC